MKVLKQDQHKIKSLLRETITLLCKNGLQYKSEFCIEGLLGITLDEKDVLLVSIKETIKEGLLESHSHIQSPDADMYDAHLQEKKNSADKATSNTPVLLPHQSVVDECDKSEFPQLYNDDQDYFSELIDIVDVKIEPISCDLYDKSSCATLNNKRPYNEENTQNIDRPTVSNVKHKSATNLAKKKKRSMHEEDYHYISDNADDLFGKDEPVSNTHEYEHKQTVQQSTCTLQGSDLGLTCLSPRNGQDFGSSNWLNSSDNGIHSVDNPNSDNLPTLQLDTTAISTLSRKKSWTHLYPDLQESFTSILSPKKDDPTVMERLQQCKHCGYRSKWLANMKRHVATHNQPTFRCPVCSHMHSTASGLKIHMKQIHQIHDFTCVCPTCKESFSSTSNLDRHLVEVHNLSKEAYSYQCSRCDRMFRLPSQLHGHWATHILTKTANTGFEIQPCNPSEQTDLV